MLKKRVTLKDIARVTGVHASTVSRALDPVESKSITEEVRNRVKATAEKLGYRPNRLAVGLRTSRTMTVGVMIPDITNVIFPPLLRGIESVLEPRGYASIIVNTDSEVERESRLVEVLRDRGVDGIIHAAVLRTDPSIARAAEDGLPVVTLNRRVEDSDIPYVINDENSGIDQMLRHLHALGHRRIAHLAGPQDLSTGLLRLGAYHSASAALGLAHDPALVVVSNRFDEQEGSRCTLDLLRAGTEFTALLCANDRLALGAMEALQARGIDVPGQVSVSGFNDMPFLDRIRPRLTTVRIQQHDAGQLAAELMLKLLAGGRAEVPIENVLAVELVIRESTGRARSGQASGDHAGTAVQNQ
jgi:LacI family transcriptional regulator